MSNVETEYDGKASQFHNGLHDDRKTHVHICAIGETRWYARVRDGGPQDGNRYEFDSDDELVLFLRKYLFAREGTVIIEKEPSEFADRLAAQYQKGWEVAP